MNAAIANGTAPQIEPEQLDAGDPSALEEQN